MASKSPLVTVIVPAYNIGAHLQNTIKSILDQSEKRFSLIIVNDGSTDDTYKVARKYARTDSRITVLQKENGGVSSARNTGISHVDTPYYTFIDGDDVIAKNYLERLLSIASEHDADIVSSQITSVSSASSLPNVLESEVESYSNTEATERFLLNKGIQNSSCAKLFSQKLKHLQFNEDLAIGEDMEYTFRAFKNSSRVAMCQDNLYYYVQRQGSAMRQSFTPKKADAYRASVLMASGSEPTAGIQKALQTKIFTEAFSTLVAMKGAETQYPELHKELSNAVSRQALEVAKSRTARKVQRLYAGVSLISVTAAVNIANVKKKYSQKRYSMNKKPLDIVVRFYDKTNLGDDLFVKVLSDRYVNKIRILSVQSQHLTDKGYAVPATSKVKYLALKAIEKASKVHGLTIRRAVNKNSVLVYIGGSIFIEGSSLSLWEEEKKMYSSLKAPFYILGSNFGPYKSKKFVDIISSILSLAKDVCFRDNASYQTFENTPSTRVASDIVFTLKKKNTHTTGNTKKVATFSIIDSYKKFNKTTASKYEDEIINLASNLVSNGYSITLMSFCQYEGDEEAISRILGKMDSATRKKTKSHLYRGDINEALETLSESSLVVASRFHATILGLLFGKKVLPIAYSDKTTNILNDIGFTGPIVDIRQIDDFNGKTFDLSTLKTNNVSEQIKLAEKQFQELDKVLIKK